MTKAVEYYQRIREIINEIAETQADVIQEAAGIVADLIAKDGVLYILGSGHSLMVAAEAHHRAGGLVPVDVIHDKTFGRAERLEGYAKVLLDEYNVPGGGVVVIASNSGRNALPIEMALECKARGIKTIAITSLAHSQSVTARHPSGKRLFEIADVVIDNRGVPGDAILEMEGCPGKFCATSAVAGAFIMQSIIAQTIENLGKMSVTPPVLISANIDGGDEHNKRIMARYRGRIKGL